MILTPQQLELADRLADARFNGNISRQRCIRCRQADEEFSKPCAQCADGRHRYSCCLHCWGTTHVWVLRGGSIFYRYQEIVEEPPVVVRDLTPH